VQFVAAVGLSLVVFAMIANLLVFSYGRGAVRAALDEGVRAGSRAAGSVAECQSRAEQTLGGLLGGPMGAGVQISCGVDPAGVSARADVAFSAWVPGVPDWAFSLEASAAQEAR
jgi:hypothetical protein